MVDTLATISLLLEKRLDNCEYLAIITPTLLSKNKDFYHNYSIALEDFIKNLNEFISADIELDSLAKINLMEGMLNIITLMSRDYSLIQQILIGNEKSKLDIIESYHQIEIALKHCVQFLYSMTDKNIDELSIVIREELNKIVFILALDINAY